MKFLPVSGANRGIGYDFAVSLATRRKTVVFAGARNPAAQSLLDLAAKHPNVHAVKLTSGNKADNDPATAQIHQVAGQLDVIIANAGRPTGLLPRSMIADVAGARARGRVGDRYFVSHRQSNEGEKQREFLELPGLAGNMCDIETDELPW
jgi:NAD(P)-dependent dehydrogenase (short-subunit alcohol dehydrogenase family)